MERNRIEVAMGEGLIAEAPALLTSSGIGSCVVLILYDGKIKTGGVAHIMLPVVNRNPGYERRGGQGAPSPGRHSGSAVSRNPGYERRQSEMPFSPYQYADSAVSTLLAGMERAGSVRSDIAARVVGGARMFSYYEENADSIGARNIDSIRRILLMEKIPLIGSDTGGSSGRSVEFFLDTGRVLVKVTGKGEIYV